VVSASFVGLKDPRFFFLSHFFFQSAYKFFAYVQDEKSNVDIPDNTAKTLRALHQLIQDLAHYVAFLRVREENIVIETDPFPGLYLCSVYSRDVRNRRILRDYWATKGCRRKDRFGTLALRSTIERK
jgi:hypothetical protein